MNRIIVALALLAVSGLIGLAIWKGRNNTVPTTPPPVVDPSEIRDVLPRDAIPAITNPKFHPAGEAPYSDDDRVLAIEINGDARAYPIRILNWHEVVDDHVGSVPVAITFCPLCGTGLAFDRRLEGTTYVFGVSGKLYKNDLVMYDRETESLWNQVSGTAIAGRLSGKKLTQLPVDHLTFGEWKKVYPSGKVLSTETGFIRNYNVDPYAGYDRSTDIGIFGQSEYDSRLPHPKTLVLGVVLDGDARAYPIDRLPAHGVVSDTVGGKELLVYNNLSASLQAAFENNLVLKGPFVGVFGKLAFKDDASGTEFSATTGQGSGGSLHGKTLTKLPGIQSFWFAWSDHYPTTGLYAP